MTKSRLKSIPMSDAIQAAMREFCDANGFVEADWIRRTLCAAMGRPELADTMTRGRPKVAKPVEEKPAKS